MCRWCGAVILRADGSVNKRKQFCDRHCVHEFLLRTDPTRWRKNTYKESMGICHRCSEVFDYYEDDGWEADHIVPLYHAHRIGDWTAWDPENLQLLCIPCHKDKTQEDYATYGRPWLGESPDVLPDSDVPHPDDLPDFGEEDEIDFDADEIPF
ncbi:HNH endonuclease [Caulobacter phage CcrSC]|uniref:HNH nuclease domain-containing protein n=1 Tax=Caulobacter phage CcrSC TaxID=2283272 RepID=A0A385ECS9_9CAUD|nr:HNH endonuclease [Caulobacter phage CcrSC]AXQ69694.1 hypothetical protein CcrSC_gp112 [Caulobacter phage CcrSC]